MSRNEGRCLAGYSMKLRWSARYIVTGEQGIDHIGPFLAGQYARGQHRHLALEHFVQGFNGGGGAVARKADQVVGVVEAIGAAAATDRFIEMLDGRVAQLDHGVEGDRGESRES